MPKFISDAAQKVFKFAEFLFLASIALLPKIICPMKYKQIFFATSHFFTVHTAHTVTIGKNIADCIF